MSPTFSNSLCSAFSKAKPIVWGRSNVFSSTEELQGYSFNNNCYKSLNFKPFPKGRMTLPKTNCSTVKDISSNPSLETTLSKTAAVLINGGNGKMGQAVALAALNAGVPVVPFAIAGPKVPKHIINLNGFEIEVYGYENRDEILSKALALYPNLVVVDFTLPAAVNDNADWYCKNKVPFVMGTTGGDRVKLLETVQNAKNYAVIAPQMGKQIVAFIAGLEALASSSPGAFSDYTLTVTESHQSTKVDTSGTAKEVIAIFQKLGAKFQLEEIEMIRDPSEQLQKLKIPEEHLNGHAYHTYRLVSPDGTVSFEFQHNVCGRSIYAEGTVDAVLFLSKKIQEKSEKTLFNMIDVLQEGAMR